MLNKEIGSMRQWLKCKATGTGSPSPKSSVGSTISPTVGDSPLSCVSSGTEGRSTPRLSSIFRSSSTDLGPDVAAVGGQGGFAGILPGGSPAHVSRRRASDAVEVAGTAVGLAKSAVAAAARGLVCSGRMPRSSSPGSDSLEADLVSVFTSPPITWAKQRREASPDFGQTHGCLPRASTVLPKANIPLPWRRSESASRQVADRLRERRRGSRTRGAISCAPADATSVAEPGLRSHSAPPFVETEGDAEAVTCREHDLPEASSLSSPLPSDVPTPTSLASLGRPASLERSCSKPPNGGTETGKAEALFPLVRCCSVPPWLLLAVPPPAAQVPSPTRLSLSPARERLPPLLMAKSSEMLQSAMRPLPAIPFPCSWAGNVDPLPQAQQLTPQSCITLDTRSPILAEPPQAVQSSRSPQRDMSPSLLCEEGLWPPPSTSTASDATSACDRPPLLIKATSAPAARSQHEDPRLREAQQLLAQMFAGSEDFGVGSKRRRSSAPPLGTRTRRTAFATLAKREATAGSSGGARIGQETSTIRLKPLNGSMPLFPTPH